jgi:DNA-binding NarL/FixJ family response regulator
MNIYGSTLLKERDRKLIALVAMGLKNKEVAVAIGTTENVVKNYMREIYDKLGMNNRVELALWYERRRFETRQAAAESRQPCSPKIMGPA